MSGFVIYTFYKNDLCFVITGFILYQLIIHVQSHNITHILMAYAKNRFSATIFFVISGRNNCRKNQINSYGLHHIKICNKHGDSFN